jgi:hypothetical protein
MDFSLLLGIHTVNAHSVRDDKKKESMNPITFVWFYLLYCCIYICLVILFLFGFTGSHFSDNNLVGPAFMGVDGGEFFYFGIIDYLCPYNVVKIIEHEAKAFLYERSKISAVPPDEYTARFIKYFEAKLVGL